ncbi:hypothetical protein EJ04DRAFT_278566 [Polyplosphaeria fusca]|uniref:Uncharacterized protein n=1 Tax=Polyplosphaeria fusca TaxID=682080 RepID=A0A9P4V7T0_9PLEO|nr:hypothetical protein EJ04DRAFT_278566 [Polyplosphaeria fusca]
MSTHPKRQRGDAGMAMGVAGRCHVSRDGWSPMDGERAKVSGVRRSLGVLMAASSRNSNSGRGRMRQGAGSTGKHARPTLSRQGHDVKHFPCQLHVSGPHLHHAGVYPHPQRHHELAPVDIAIALALTGHLPRSAVLAALVSDDRQPSREAVNVQLWLRARPTARPTQGGVQMVVSQRQTN